VNDVGEGGFISTPFNVVVGRRGEMGWGGGWGRRRVDGVGGGVGGGEEWMGWGRGAVEMGDCGAGEGESAYYRPLPESGLA